MDQDGGKSSPVQLDYLSPGATPSHSNGMLEIVLGAACLVMSLFILYLAAMLLYSAFHSGLAIGSFLVAGISVMLFASVFGLGRWAYLNFRDAIQIVRRKPEHDLPA